jgi:sulfate transport system substrate-binding protein
MFHEFRHALRHLSGPVVVLVAGIAAAVALLAGSGGASDSRSSEAIAATGERGTIALVGFSAPQVALDEVIPAFQRTPAGRGVGVRTSYGASGDQSRAVAAGLPADLVAFSVAPDVRRLETAGLVAPGWDQGPAHGSFATSLVVFLVRPGNPKRIRTWADLLRPGVEVLTPSPLTSGSAKWNLLAAYGQASRSGGAQAGLSYVRRLLGEHVTVQDKSAREALQSFAAGNGDVLLSYESEAVTARRKGEQVDYVIPERTIRIDLPLAVTADGAGGPAEAFAAHLRSTQAQRVLARWGYRPVDPAARAAEAARFPAPAELLTIDDLGGWEAVDRPLFDPQTGALVRLAREAR